MNWVAFFTALVGFGGIAFACVCLFWLMDWVESRYSVDAALCTGIALAVITFATVFGVLAS